MPEPRSCILQPPLTVCHDQPCLEACIEYTKNERSGIIEPKKQRTNKKSECLPCPHGCTKKGEPMLFSNKGMLAWHIKSKHTKGVS